MPTGYVKAARMGELAPGQKKLVQIGGDRILLANLEGNYYAVDDVCPHAYGVLSMGQMAGDEVICPLHYSAFNVKTGEVLSPPCDEGLTVYGVKLEGDDILVGPPVG